MHDNDSPENDQFDRPSKSQRKREMHQLQELGERLATLAPAALAPLPLSDGLRIALDELRRIQGREGRRRQLQYIGRLMRSEDGDTIAAALEGLTGRPHINLRRNRQASDTVSFSRKGTP